MKAFVITMDALVAISVLFIALLVLSTMTFHPYAPRGVYLKQLTLDTLTLMDKTGKLGPAVEGNSAGIRRLLDATPELVCMQVSITDSNDEVIATIPKNNCGETGRELQVATRRFLYSGEPHNVRAQSWYRREFK